MSPRTVALAALLFTAIPALAASSFTVAPPPRWIDSVPVDLAISTPQKGARWGTFALLADHQVQVTPSAATDYYHDVRKVLSPSGVQNASELTFDFDPSYQQLVIHSVTLIRGSERIDALVPAQVRVIAKEDESGDHLYDGILTAIAVVDDVRPGDVLDYAWSLTGANPLLSGRYADSYDLTAEVPTKLIRHRLLIAPNRKLRFHSTLPGNEPRLRVDDISPSERSYTWERRDVAASEHEDHTPDWFDPYAHIEVSEFASWHEVAVWADALFQMDAASREAVRNLAASIRRADPASDDAAVAAIRFVQDDIRYLGIEMGRNSHEPHQPAAVLEQRWGDCKDKSFLLAALLRELGIDAYPALVNTKLRHSMDLVLPSPFSFDHVITEVVTKSGTRWIDPTLADQGGTLQTIETPNDERALVIRPATEGLAHIETRQNGATHIERVYTTTSWSGPTELVVRVTCTGGDADALRSDLATMSDADFARERLNRRATQEPKIRATAPIRIVDDRERNSITTEEHYSIPDLWKDGRWTYAPKAIADHFQHPETVVRSTPLEFDFPLHVTERVTVNAPGALQVDADERTDDTDVFHYRLSTRRSGNSVIIVTELAARKDAVAPAAVADHLARINAIDDNGITLTRAQPQLAGAMTSTGGFMTLVAALALAIGVTIGKRL